MFWKVLWYASQHDSAVWRFLKATTITHNIRYMTSCLLIFQNNYVEDFLTLDKDLFSLMNITKWGMVEEEIHHHDLVDLNVFGFNPLKCYYD